MAQTLLKIRATLKSSLNAESQSSLSFKKVWAISKNRTFKCQWTHHLRAVLDLLEARAEACSQKFMCPKWSSYSHQALWVRNPSRGQSGPPPTCLDRARRKFLTTTNHQRYCIRISSKHCCVNRWQMTSFWPKNLKTRKTSTMLGTSRRKLTWARKWLLESMIRKIRKQSFRSKIWIPYQKRREIISLFDWFIIIN